MDVFESCKEINSLISLNEESAREKLILLLDYHRIKDISYSPLLNHLIRLLGLYPYIDIDTAELEDQYVYEAFKADCGEKSEITLHKEQSKLLKKLLNRDSLAVSAPTSFGKSFIIDALIKLKSTNNVLIIVPTIALADEVRRRIYRKFSNEYCIVTTTDVELLSKNILIMPQERAIKYLGKIITLDLLVVDEFYKASNDLGDERTNVLQKVILEFSKISKQKYFLAPNISSLRNTPLTQNLEFCKIEFNGVVLKRHDIYCSIKDEEGKKVELLKILAKNQKTLIYAGTYADITKVANIVTGRYKYGNSDLLRTFSKWLEDNYFKNWSLANLVKLGCGIHNGRLHRSLSLIQIKLFEEVNGLINLISTSSLIEGVNTSAENVVVWRNKNGSHKLNDFSFKNIIGRSGRMFKYFIGNVYILEKPPINESLELVIEFSDNELHNIDEEEYQNVLTQKQINKIIQHKSEIYQYIDKEDYDYILKNNLLQSNLDTVNKIVLSIAKNPAQWRGLSFLNSTDTSKWDILYNVIKLDKMDDTYTKIVEFTKIISHNWSLPIPSLLIKLHTHQITIEDFFKLERTITFKLTSLLSDINVILHYMKHVPKIDVSSFIAKLSHAFLPSVVYQLEEYGMPRMISRKIQQSGLIDFENQRTSLDSVIKTFNQLGNEQIKKISTLDEFDKYIIDYFYDGIST